VGGYDFSQLHYLNREIESDRERVLELEAIACGTGRSIAGLPHGGGVADKTAIAAEIADIKAVIEKKIMRAAAEYKRLVGVIEAVDDSYMRLILMARHVDGLSWENVAIQLGGGNTGDGVRMAHGRFLKKMVGRQ